jgi:hypothetical protein
MASIEKSGGTYTGSLSLSASKRTALPVSARSPQYLKTRKTNHPKRKER